MSKEKALLKNRTPPNASENNHEISRRTIIENNTIVTQIVNHTTGEIIEYVNGEKKC